MSKTMSDKQVVVIGGGTGSFSVLSGMKEYFSNITATVNMVDDGGSTGVLRDELGVLPPGDVRQCLVALSDAPDDVRQLFNYRFGEGSLAGHSFGNLFLSAMERMNNDFIGAVEMAASILQISGRVLPLTIDNCRLCLQNQGKLTRGESAIGEETVKKGSQPKLWIEPNAIITEQAKIALKKADAIVVAPGNLYQSLIPSLLVGGVTEAIDTSKAQVIYIANLVNKPNHTQGFSVMDYVSEIERFMGKRGIDCVLYNTAEPSEELMKRYALEGEYPVIVDQQALSISDKKIVGSRLLLTDVIKAQENDTRIARSYIRHDGEAIASALTSII